MGSRCTAGATRISAARISPGLRRSAHTCARPRRRRDRRADVGYQPATSRVLCPELATRLQNAMPTTVIDPESERARLFDAVDMLVEHVSLQQPMLFVLDDVHWADRPTLGLLRRLLQSDRPGAVLFLATYRDTDVDRRHPLAEVLADLRREPRAVAPRARGAR